MLTESAGAGAALSAIGVQFTLKGDAGTVHAVHAGKEVILSAGYVALFLSVRPTERVWLRRRAVFFCRCWGWKLDQDAAAARAVWDRQQGDPREARDYGRAGPARRRREHAGAQLRRHLLPCVPFASLLVLSVLRLTTARQSSATTFRTRRLMSCATPRARPRSSRHSTSPSPPPFRSHFAHPPPASAKGEGFFTTAHLGFVFAPLEWLSPRGKALHDAHKEKYAAKRDAYPIGLREQYDIMVGRLDGLAPGCELLPFAGFSSFPSACSRRVVLFAVCNGGLTRVLVADPPAEGKKYFSYYLSMNHQWSRGSTVSTSPPASYLTGHARRDAFFACFAAHRLGGSARAACDRPEVL